LLQGRFKSVAVSRDEWALALSRYVHLYRDYVETAAREGLERSPWKSVKKQAALGSAEFLAELKQQQEQRGVRRRMAERPPIEAVIAAVERVKGRRWAEFRDEYGDGGRVMALYLGRRLCGLKLAEVAKAVGLRNSRVHDSLRVALNDESISA
jgi:hypothetical protein